MGEKLGLASDKESNMIQYVKWEIDNSVCHMFPRMRGKLELSSDEESKSILNQFKSK